MPINRKNSNEVKFFDVNLFLLSISYSSRFHANINTGFGDMTTFFIEDLPEIEKSEIPPSEIGSISEDWNNLGMLNLARMSLIKCHWMLQNARATAFFVSELLRKTHRGKVKLPNLNIWACIFFLFLFLYDGTPIFKSA